MGLLNRFKVKGSSLVESIVAMAIIAICLSIALVVYVNVLHINRGLPYYTAEQKVKELFWKEMDKPFLEDEDFTYATFRIQKKIEKINGINNAYKLTFTVKAPNREKSYAYVLVQ